MSLHNFFTLKEIRKEGDKHLAAITLNPEHEIYKGHFPGNPVVPGVCLLHILKSICSDIVKKPAMLRTGDTIKYLQVINPNVATDMSWEIYVNETDEHSFNVRCITSWKGMVCFKFVGGFVSSA